MSDDDMLRQGRSEESVAASQGVAAVCFAAMVLVSLVAIAADLLGFKP